MLATVDPTVKNDEQLTTEQLIKVPFYGKGNGSLIKKINFIFS